jgi:hypothetical protein
MGNLGALNPSLQVRECEIWASGAQVNLAGADGSDAHHDQEREVRDAIVQLRRRPEEGQDVTDR